MKLRFRDDSLRIRLGRSEVRALAEGQRVHTATHFGPGQELRTSVSTGGDQISARLHDHEISVMIPAGTVKSWCESEDLTLEGQQTWADGALRIAIEKDLVCTSSRPGETETDSFPRSLPKTQQC